MAMTTLRNDKLAGTILERILDMPDVQAFLDATTAQFLDRPMPQDRDDPTWWACRQTILNLLLLDVTLQR